MAERLLRWWGELTRPERTALATLAAIGTGILLFVLGIQLGQALWLFAGLVA
ncbi:hypothetical protein [Microbulbifer yueqingensis]|uniref:Uncharacterized protein n=1 Tax=Microbulbifer yueqingensis TaxID=658219 RepID=A0A1G9DC80_9GAMM|nr:hypothetical protein [Microbulbifer yueqingensis]SDK61445.1 hypothetical protein SAMN05216212_2728 [Microbulbifer yueqingensis]